MSKFHYKAVRSGGEAFEGVVEVADRFAVYAHVRKEGGAVLSIEESGAKTFSFDVSRLFAFLGRVHTSEKIIFARNLSAMITAGLSLSRALSVLERQTKNDRFKKVLVSIDERIKKGNSLHEAMGEFPDVFPKLFTAMVKAGEESGKLAESLTVVAEQTERINNLNKKIRGAMMYPGIILIAMLAIGVAMFIYVVPTIATTFKEFNVPLPLSTRLVIGMSDLLLHNSLIILASILALSGAFVAALRSPRGKRTRDFVLLHMPIIGPLVRETNAARTARTLSSLLSSGVEVVAALGITAEVIQNSYFREVLAEAEAQIQKGKQIAAAFESHEDLYPPLVGELIAVGEETGQLSSMLLQIATFYENEVEQKTKNMSTIIEPFLMITIGIAVGFFALSVIGPIYSLSNAI